ncbi:hypothetical protein LEP1GSC055_2632 [Leptospira borgpetersenii str. Brem 307]|uniref:Uncharacterized protein n=1 Tax=Leptospira borgpetersenii str. Brem 328 TaxID=1049780 RepID=A0ABC9SN06_LEPBO|nr:hypothetical protein LEP1GSC055_2632 [Leptospira borgpetersenii str. Brem 307]EMN18975.1 hypothetical protein LEP1GSC056_2045 [Leptospira borgpetersenii str. Brem 328]
MGLMVLFFPKVHRGSLNNICPFHIDIFTLSETSSFETGS